MQFYTLAKILPLKDEFLDEHFIFTIYYTNTIFRWNSTKIDNSQAIHNVDQFFSSSKKIWRNIAVTFIRNTEQGDTEIIKQRTLSSVLNESTGKEQV